MSGKWKIGVVVSALLLGGCVKAGTLPKKNEPLTLVIATDLHYLAPELHDQGERFQRLIEESDGKLTEKSETLVDQFVQEMLQKKPQAVLAELCAELPQLLHIEKAVFKNGLGYKR